MRCVVAADAAEAPTGVWEVLFFAGWGTKEAENIFSHTAGGLMKSGSVTGCAGYMSIFLLLLNVAWQ
jgi:hypothetical protein